MITRVMIAGPTTLATLLNCLQMGFRSVALAERSKEVWNVLGADRTEFGKFAEAVAAVKKRLGQAQSAVDGVEVRTGEGAHASQRGRGAPGSGRETPSKRGRS